MSADVLRRAAALMRERAEGATPGPWERDGGWAFAAPAPESWEGPYLIGETYGTRNDAEHITSWHPAVALAVADLLDAHAETYDGADLRDGGRYSLEQDDWADAAARAYLGEQP